MRFARFVELLEPFAGRVAGSEAERWCQETLAATCRAAGADAQVQGFVDWLRPGQFVAVHGFSILLALLLARFWPSGSLLLALVLLASAWAEANSRSWVRWGFLKGISSNMVARFTRVHARTQVVVIAQADVPRVAPVPNAVRIRFGGRDRTSSIHASLLPILLTFVLVGVMVAENLGLSGLPLHILIWCVAVSAGLQFFLGIAWDRGGAAGGSNANGSGLAVLAGIAESFDPETHPHIELWLVASGASVPGCCGTRAFLRRYRHRLHADRTFIIELREVGRGTLAVVRGDIIAKRWAFDAEIVGHAAHLGQHDSRFHGVALIDLLGRTDAGEATRAGYAAIGITALVGGERDPQCGTTDDIADHLDPRTMMQAHEFVEELLEVLEDAGSAGLHAKVRAGNE